MSKTTEALEFYSDPDNYIRGNGDDIGAWGTSPVEQDRGAMALAALREQAALKETERAGR